jgi:hypothetical protein
MPLIKHLACDNALTVKNNPRPQDGQITLFDVLWLSFVACCALFVGRRVAGEGGMGSGWFGWHRYGE